MKSADQLRQQARKNRRALTPKQVSTLSAQACEHFIHHPWFINSRNIAAFFACDGESDPEYLIDRAFRMNKRLFFPVLKPGLHRSLWFHEYIPGDKLVVNRYNIAEPVPRPSTRARLHSMDIVLTPLVCFDENGHRLGMGGGYYDRTFSFLQHRTRWRKPKLVGMAYESQKVSNITQNSWDIPLDAALTEKNLYQFKNKQT